ncbi:MAG: serine/threonine protein kinase [Methylococcaceae bacterium]|nr:serine/threonine protein kinase [Methylococcaceae bacterium]
MTSQFSTDEYPDTWYFLQPGTVIDEYIIERPLAGGGFSSVYLARQRCDQHQVAIKEYLPRKLAHRTWGNDVVPQSEKTKGLFLKGRKLFLEEARLLTKLRHPNIVEVLNFFQANSTAYLVMTYDYGMIMNEYLKDKGGAFKEEELVSTFMKVLEGLRVVHREGLLHLDIKPHNILIRPGGEPLLLDFGAVQPYPNVGHSKVGKVLTQGFSPVEQYRPDGKIGPWSDLYALGASMRMCLDGQPPPPAPKRAKKDTLIPAAKAFRKKYSPHVLEAIDKALAVDYQDRPRSVEEFEALLQPTVTV